MTYEGSEELANLIFEDNRLLQLWFYGSHHPLDDDGNDDDEDEKEGHKAAATFYEDEAAQVGGVNIVEEGKDRFDMSDNFLKPVNITQSKTLNFKQRAKESQLRGKFARASTHKKRSSLANDDDHIERGNINYRK